MAAMFVVAGGVRWRERRQQVTLRRAGGGPSTAVVGSPQEPSVVIWVLEVGAFPTAGRVLPIRMMRIMRYHYDYTLRILGSLATSFGQQPLWNCQPNVWGGTFSHFLIGCIHLPISSGMAQRLLLGGLADNSFLKLYTNIHIS